MRTLILFFCLMRSLLLLFCLFFCACLASDCLVTDNPANLSPYDPATQACTSVAPGQNVTFCGQETSIRKLGCACAFNTNCSAVQNAYPIVDNAFFLWPDADGDGQGDRLAAPVRACNLTAGFVQNNWDCDDTNALIYRGTGFCKSRDPTSLATVYPTLAFSPFQNNVNPDAICVPKTSIQRWGMGVSVHDGQMASATPCFNSGTVWNWDDTAKQWVLQTMQFKPCAPGVKSPNCAFLGSPGFGRSVSIWGSYVVFSCGTNDAVDDGIVNGLTVFTGSGGAWSMICCSAQTLAFNVDNVNLATHWPHVQIASQRIAACYYVNSDGSSRASLFSIVSNTLVEYDLCACSGASCPIGWPLFRGSKDMCNATGGILLGAQCAINRRDGLEAVFADKNNNLYFFWYNAVSVTWEWTGLNISANPGGQVNPGESLGMYGEVTAMGFPLDTPSQPTPVMGSSACNVTGTGYVIYLTRPVGVLPQTWSLQPGQLMSPSACTFDACGTTVRVGSDSRVLFSCPQTNAASGSRFGYAVEINVASGLGAVSYPNAAKMFNPPYEQRGDGTGAGLGAMSFAESMDVSDERYVFSSSSVATSGEYAQGRLWSSRCNDEMNCV